MNTNKNQVRIETEYVNAITLTFSLFKSQIAQTIATVLDTASSLTASYAYSRRYYVSLLQGDVVESEAVEREFDRKVFIDDNFSLVDLLAYVMYSLFLFGKAYVYTKEPLTVLSPLLVTSANDQSIVYNDKEISRKDIFEVRIPNPAFPTIERNLTLLFKNDIEVLEEAKRLIAEFFENSAVPSGLLLLKTDNKNALKRLFEELERAKEKPFKVLALNAEEAEFVQMSHVPSPSDFVKLVKEISAYILSLLNIPPALLGLSPTAKSTLTEQKQVFYSAVVRPLLSRVEKVANHLLRKFSFPYNLRYDTFFIADESVAIEKARLGAMLGVLTINEVRQLLGFPPLAKGGEQLLPNWNAPKSAKTEFEKQIKEFMTKDIGRLIHDD